MDCPNVKVLPDDLHIADHLHQSKCPNLVNLAGLPRQKLTTPLIVRCNKLKARPNWMHNLASLQKLTIHTRSSKRRICPTASGTREEGLLRLWLQLSHQPRWLSIDYEKIYKPLCWNFVMLFHDKHDYTSKVFRRDRRSIICVRIKRIIKKKKTTSLEICINKLHRFISSWINIHPSNYIYSRCKMIQDSLQKYSPSTISRSYPKHK